MTRPPTEILVHIAAASRASDDVRYQALAQAHANFELAGRLDVVTNSLPKGSIGSAGSASSSAPNTISIEECRQPVSSSVHPFTSIIAVGQSFQSVSLSFESVWDNVQSPGIAPVPAPHPPPPRRHHHYVSPDDYIPDSQSEDERRARRRRILEREDGDNSPLSQRAFDVSRIEESQDVASSRAENESDAESNIRIRDAASPDLSAMPMDLTGSILEDSQDQLPSQSLSSRQPLTQRSANSQQSSQNEDDDGFLKSSPPLHEWEAIPSSAVASSLDLGVGQRISYGADVPSSLPEESGKVVIRIDSSSCELRGLSASLPSSGAPGLPRADSEPIRKKRQRESDHAVAGYSGVDHRLQNLGRRRVSDAGQPLLKKKQTGQNTETEAVGTSVTVQTSADQPADASGGALRVPSQPFPSSSPTASAPGLYLDQTLRIISPDPPVACEHLDSAALVTEKMAKLARDLDLERRYRPLPSSDGRAVRPFERGYWRLNTAGWPAALRHQAWSFLRNYIGAGDAGWSVWCSRDPAPHTWLRLSCFAATVGHTYLILYLASQRQILTTGAVWLDGSGTPTITVPPRKKKQPSGTVDVFTNTY